jgi:formylglycine-generating enzyme required for sulfatase activity
MLARDVWAETTLLAVGHLSVIQRVPGRAAQLVEGFLRAELTGDVRGLNVVRAGEALRDVGSKGVTDTVWNATLTALQAAMVDAALLPGTRRDAGIALGELGWLPEDLDAMVSVPAGEFLYGDENRPRQIGHTFDIGKYAVTNAQFKRFILAGGYSTQRWWSPDGWERREKQNWERPRYWDDTRFNNSLQPVVGVSWYEADAYCNWLKEETGKDYRLPTEEEWEKAARGVKGKLYPWGKEFDKKKANTGESELSATTPVMMYPDGESDCGALDLSGNVWEWTKSKYDRKEPYFVLRGGSWRNTAVLARSAYRGPVPPVLRHDNIGFRCVAVPPGSPPK